MLCGVQSEYAFSYGHILAIEPYKDFGIQLLQNSGIYPRRH